MCVFVSRPMKIVTTPKRVVDFLRERDTFRNKTMKIVEDFVCEAQVVHVFFVHHFFFHFPFLSFCRKLNSSVTPDNIFIPWFMFTCESDLVTVDCGCDTVVLVHARFPVFLLVLLSFVMLIILLPHGSSFVLDFLLGCSSTMCT